MNISNLYEITSNDRILTGLGLAIEEARMTRSLMRSRARSAQAESGERYAEKLAHLEREIEYLEAKLNAVLSKINRE